MERSDRYKHRIAKVHPGRCVECKSSTTSWCDHRLYALDRSSTDRTTACGVVLSRVDCTKSKSLTIQVMYAKICVHYVFAVWSDQRGGGN